MVVFCVGTGRCGTTFLSRVADLEPHVAGSHERHRLADTFHMFCQWHDIPVDPEGFLSGRRALVAADLADHDVSFEATALVSHSIDVLHEDLGAHIVWLVRHPVPTVASFAARGWFVEPIPWADRDRVPSLPEAMNPRHFLGRNLPSGAAFDRWLLQTQIGRIAWFWQARNRDIATRLRRIPPSHRHVVRLEDLDHHRWVQLAAALGFEARVTASQFDALSAERPNASENSPVTPEGWGADDIAQLEAQVGPLAAALGYETEVAALLGGAPLVTSLAPTVEGVLAALDG